MAGPRIAVGRSVGGGTDEGGMDGGAWRVVVAGEVQRSSQLLRQLQLQRHDEVAPRPGSTEIFPRTPCEARGLSGGKILERILALSLMSCYVQSGARVAATEPAPRSAAPSRSQTGLLTMDSSHLSAAQVLQHSPALPWSRGPPGAAAAARPLSVAHPLHRSALGWPGQSLTRAASRKSHGRPPRTAWSEPAIASVPAAAGIRLPTRHL